MPMRKRKKPKQIPEDTRQNLMDIEQGSDEIVKYLITGEGASKGGLIDAGMSEGAQGGGLVPATVQAILQNGGGGQMLMPMVDGARAAVNVQGYGIMLKAFQLIHGKLDNGLCTTHELLRIIEVTGMRMSGLERVVTDLASALGKENAAKALGLTVEKTETTRLHVPKGTELSDIDKRALDKLMGGGDRPGDVVLDFDVVLDE